MFPPRWRDSLMGGTLLINAGILLTLDLLLPSSYTRKHLDLPSSRATPLNTCPGLRPRWYPEYIAIAHPGLLLSDTLNRVSFHPALTELILMTTTIHISGLNTEPASLPPPASDSPCGACPRVQLLTCWLSFSQVGLSFNLQCQSKPCKEDM